MGVCDNALKKACILIKGRRAVNIGKTRKRDKAAKGDSLFYCFSGKSLSRAIFTHEKEILSCSSLRAFPILS